MEQNDPMREWLACERKVLLWERVRTVLVLLCAVPLILFAFSAARDVKAANEQLQRLDAVEDGIDTLTAEVVRAEGQLSALSAAAGLITQAVDAETLSEVTDDLKDALSSISGAGETIAELDVDSLNAILTRLGGEIDGISGALDTVSQLDPEAINNLLTRLDEVMDTLNKVSDVLDKLSAFRLFGGG